MKNTNVHKQEIIDLYKSGKSSLQIAKQLGFCKSAILRCLERNGIKRRPLTEAKRKYSFDYNYFENINCEEKAYFLGLLCADGYNDEKRGIVSISLQARDVKILEDFKKSINWSGELYTEDSGHKKNPKHQILKKITLVSKKLSQDLSLLGCVNLKSRKLTWPKNLKNKYMNHFIRGYFDGDGFVSKKETVLPKISIASTREFCEGFNDFIENLLNINVQLFKCKRHKNNTIVMEISGRRQVCLFLDWAYKNATIYLERKFERYLGLKNKKLDNRGKTYHNTELTINKEKQKQYATV